MRHAEQRQGDWEHRLGVTRDEIEELVRSPAQHQATWVRRG